MGTELVIATSVTALGLKTILGSFITILLLLISYNLFKTSNTIKVITYTVICGLLAISTLILFSLAIDSAVSGVTWL